MFGEACPRSGSITEVHAASGPSKHNTKDILKLNCFLSGCRFGIVSTCHQSKVSSILDLFPRLQRLQHNLGPVSSN